MGKELAVIFPGMGYHTDKPLLYYSKKIAARKNYDVIEIDYDFDYEVHGAGKLKVFEDAYARAYEIMQDVDLSQYERIVFIGKSIGTVVAAKYNQDYAVGAELIVFTPVEKTFMYIFDSDCMVFHGSADPLCDTDMLINSCEEDGITYVVIPDANHSLETQDVLRDIDNIHKVMEMVEKIL